MSHFIPAKGRLDFYEYIDLNLDDDEYAFNPKSAIEDAGLGMLEHIYLNQAIAALDLGLDIEIARKLLAESALAGVLSVANSDHPLPFYQLLPFLGLFVVGDDEVTLRHAQRVVDAAASKRRSVDPHMQALALALAGSVREDTKLVRRAIADANAAAAKITKPKSRAAWASSISNLAAACLIGAPIDLSHLLEQAAIDTRSWWGTTASLEDQNYESYFAQFPLAFAARAKARRFKLPTVDPNPNLPMQVLALPTGKLPKHPWYKWPKPSATLKKAFAAALELENSLRRK